MTARLNALGVRLGRNTLRRVGRKALTPVRDRARLLAPKDDGQLARDIVIRSTLTRRQFTEARRFKAKSAISMYLGTNNPLGVPHEFGTAHMPAHPFLRPAWDMGVRGILNVIVRELRPEIEKTERKAGFVPPDVDRD